MFTLGRRWSWLLANTSHRPASFKWRRQIPLGNCAFPENQSHSDLQDADDCSTQELTCGVFWQNFTKSTGAGRFAVGPHRTSDSKSKHPKKHPKSQSPPRATSCSPRHKLLTTPQRNTPHHKETRHTTKKHATRQRSTPHHKETGHTTKKHGSRNISIARQAAWLHGSWSWFDWKIARRREN